MQQKMRLIIYHFLQRSTAQPHLKILLLPPMLPNSQNQNLLPPKITNTPAPYTGAEPVAQTPRVQTLTTSPT